MLGQITRLAEPRTTLEGSLLRHIMAAKRAASTQFLDPKRERAPFHGFAVSPDPRDNVAAVGVGPRLRAGQVAEEWCVRIYVEQKIESAALPGTLLLPTQVEGVPVDVIESGRFSSFLVPLGRQRLRPAQPGCSVGVRSPGENRLTSGTLGALAERSGTRYILSNNHVLNPQNSRSTGTDVFQPGYLDALGPEPIARLTSVVPLQPSNTNFVDCAIAEILRPDLVDPIFLPAVGRLSAAGPADPANGMKVEKVGRTSGYTTGDIVDMSVDVRVGFLHGSYIFHDQFLVQGETRVWPSVLSRLPGRIPEVVAKLRVLQDRRSFSAPGDSGSVIVDRLSKRAIGLLVGGSSDWLLSVASPIQRVLRELGIALVS